MLHHILFNFIQCFSFIQQYFIILSLSFIFVILFSHWWCIILLPLSTIIANLIIRRLSDNHSLPLKCSGYIYSFLIRRKRNHNRLKSINESNSYETLIQKECDVYIRTIIARYVGTWYYSFISTDQDFPQDLIIIFRIILHRLSDRLKIVKSYDIIRLIINLKQRHIEQYLRSSDLYRKQRKSTRISKSFIEEFSQTIGFHHAIVNNDIPAYLKALVELLLTDLLPESFHIYSVSKTGREFLTQIIVNCIFLPLLNQFSKPRMIYYMIILLWETEKQKTYFETNENSLRKQTKSTINPIQNEHIMNFYDQSNHNNETAITSLERVIYSATILSYDTLYDSMFGAPYTVYIIQVRENKYSYLEL